MDTQLADLSHLKWTQDSSTFYLTKRLIREYLKPYKKILYMGLFCMVVGAAATAFLAKQMEPIIDDVFIGKNTSMLLWVSFQVFVLFLFKGLSNYGQSVAMTHVGEGIVADMRKQLIDHIISADLSFYHNTHTGELLSRFTTDVNALHRVVSRTITNLVKDGLTLVFLVILMFYTDWVLASFAFIAFPLAFYPIIKIGKKIRKSTGSIQREMAEFSILLSQVFHGARLIKSYGMQKYENNRAVQVVDNLFNLIMKNTRSRSATHPIMEMLGGVAIVIVICYGGMQVIEGNQTSGAFFSFITALLLAYEPMKHLASLNTELQEKLAVATRVFAVLSVEPEIKDHKDSQDLTNVKGNITFKDVHFSYNERERILHGINLEIPAGKTVALVGASGSGKSTLMNLIPRFYEVESGAVLVDGKDIRDIKLASLRAASALVSQEVTLFDDTIRGNISYGKPDATDAEIFQAAQGAAAHEFITELPDGYDTFVGEQGIKLSGGQRQRIAIARAMLKDAPILLLDEATSALDSESEQIVQKALQTLMKGKTTLIIAHRLSTVVDADIIYVIDKGEVIGSGKHDELIKSNKKYERLCKAQFGKK